MSETIRSGGVAGLENDLSGRQLGDYRLLRRLGSGGMAEVYLAEQCSLRRQVALKVLKRELAKDESYVRRFHHEAQAAAALVHANIVQIHEVACVDGIHYIVQEYVAGVNLRELCARKGPLEVRLAASILRQVTAALVKAAEQGIVHRDIKPENILLTKAGEVKVADFGLARITGAADSLNLTQTGMTMGTPLYMSPEQVEGKELDPRSDIYSLGVTAYQMFSGAPPFRGETAVSVAVQHVRSQPEPLAERRPDLPLELCAVVHKMLAKKPADRYPNARELLRELRSVSTGKPVEDASTIITAAQPVASLAPRPALTQPAVSETTQRLSVLMHTQTLAVRRRRHWWQWVAAAAVAAFIVGALGAWLRRQPFLLDAPAAETTATTIERRDSALEQYLYAVQLGTEAGWKSVGRYFPNDKKYLPRAQQQLAELYLQQDNFAAALKIFQDFAHADEVERSYRAFGLAGECVAYSLLGKQKESSTASGQLATLAGGLQPAKLEPLMDRQLVRLVGFAVRKNRQALDKQTTSDWDKWLDTHFHDDAPSSGQSPAGSPIPAPPSTSK
jgi:serine/threonine-protein kinase